MNSKKIKKNFFSLFPIYKNELKTFLPLCMISFCISYNFSLLRSIKDILILQEGGAAAIYYLKFFGVAPSLLLLTYIYTNMSKTFNMRVRFNIVLCYFVVFFLIFIIFFFPNRDILKISTQHLVELYPNLKSFWSIISNWHISLFYIHAESWGNFVLGVIFWTLANTVISLKQSKRFYSLLAVSSNVGSIVSGVLLTYLYKSKLNLSLVSIIIISCVSIFIFNYLIKKERKKIDILEKEKTFSIKNKTKIGFQESLKNLISSKYLLTIAIMVIAYGFAISLFEAVWKENMKEYVGDNNDLMATIFGRQLIYIGIVSILLSLTLSSIIQKRGWQFGAFFTPIVFAFACTIFFLFIFYGKHLKFLLHFFDSTPLGLATMVGLSNVVFIKASKYSFFDTSKETAYIPLNEESKIRGKAIIDGNAQILGKSLASIFITVSSILGGGNIRSIQKSIAITILCIIVVWFMATNTLNRLFKKVSEKKNNNA